MRKPETRIATVVNVTMNEVRSEIGLDKDDIGKWVVLGSGRPIKCESYREASSLASSLNRCPA